MNKNRFESLQDIENRKKELRLKIERQEEILVKDFDAYQEDMETLKRLWKTVKGIRKTGCKVRTGGNEALSLIANKLPGTLDVSKLTSIISTAGSILFWLWERKRKNKKK